MFSVATRSSFAGWKKLLPFKSLSSRRTRAGSSRTQCLRFSSSPKEHSLRSELSRLAAPHSFLAEGNESDVKLPSQRDTEQLIKIRHSAAHVLAMAVQKLFPSAKVAIGPWIENGFYYDFEIPDYHLRDSDLTAIEKEMNDIIKRSLPIVEEQLDVENARLLFSTRNEKYKLEILDSIKESAVSVYRIGDWPDLCKGPHLESTGQLRTAGVQLESVAGAYWRGNENNLPMLQRIYGTAWETKEQLEQYRKLQAQIALRDHRALGKRFDLFSIQDNAGGGLVFWHPRGARVRRCIEDYWRHEHTQAGYELLYSPHIANADLWVTSGHMDYYKKDMFTPIPVDDERYILKPMNCPFHCLVYKNSHKSYRDFPIRWAELGTVYRYERSGTLHGLMRVRGFTQDDAHIFCLNEQLEDEIVAVLNLTEKILQRFGFSHFDISLSTRPAESVGSDALWESATSSLRNAMSKKGFEYEIDHGGGAFYGPKIDIKIRDAIGRKWQCSTIQCDFNLPSRFNLEYTASDGTKKTPVMVHRAIFGSLERFFGILLESNCGDFPLWLAPEQLRLLPVSNAEIPFCRMLRDEGIRDYGLRVEIDESGERLSKKIRNAEVSRVPLMAVVGKKELVDADKCISIRSRKGMDLGAIPALELFKALHDAIQSKPI